MEDNLIPEIYTPAFINKSIPVKQDKDGNYIIEVEASNENLDLQNQRILQSALMKSKDFFLQDGVISDDHQHKKRLDDGSVESDKTKIIGEPISVRTEGTKTFVKAKIYSAVESAKPFIDLLKAGSSLVKASVGGIMPKVKKNPDGSETVTSFLWNDLALTCSPVNWTVGGAVFAKSMSNQDFVKALCAGVGSDASTFTDGRALQGEDLEKKTKNVMPEDLATAKEVEKAEEPENSDEAVIREAVICIDTGELTSKKAIENFLIGKGFDKSKARETTREIINEGGRKMAKSHFSDTVSNLLKSLGGSKPAVEKSDDEEEKDDEKKPVLDEETIDIEEESGDDDEKDDDVEKCAVKKSLDDEEFDDDEYIDGTELLKSMSDKIDALEGRILDLESEKSDLQKSILDVANAMTQIGNEPVERQTIMQKSINSNVAAAGKYVQPTKKEFDDFKNALCKSFKDKEFGMSLEKSAHLESVFQKAVMGKKMNESDEREIRAIYEKYGK